jgi:hypothetical protein
MSPKGVLVFEQSIVGFEEEIFGAPPTLVWGRVETGGVDR